MFIQEVRLGRDLSPCCYSVAFCSLLEIGDDNTNWVYPDIGSKIGIESMAWKSREWFPFYEITETFHSLQLKYKGIVDDIALSTTKLLRRLKELVKLSFLWIETGVAKK